MKCTTKQHLKKGRYLFSTKAIIGMDDYICEIRILEYSPTHQFIKIQHISGSKDWLSITDFEQRFKLIERLGA